MTRGQRPCTVARMSHSVFRLVRAACVGIVLIAPALARAQSAGSIAGTVVDTSGATVPGATVAITHQGTGTTTTTVTTRQGTFVVPQVPPGAYSVEARLEGFRTAIVIPVSVHVDTRVSLDLVLEPGTINETVRVEGRLNIDRASPGVGTSSTAIHRQPLNGRSFHTLLELTPGVVMTKPSITSPGQFSQRPARQRQLLHGRWRRRQRRIDAGRDLSQATGTLPAFTISGGTNALVSSEALRSSLQTSSYAPEFGAAWRPGVARHAFGHELAHRVGSSTTATRSSMRTTGSTTGSHREAEARSAPQFGGALAVLRVPGIRRPRPHVLRVARGLAAHAAPERVVRPRASSDARRLATGVLEAALRLVSARQRLAIRRIPRYRRHVVSVALTRRPRLDQQAGPRLRLFGRVNHTPSQSKERARAQHQRLPVEPHDDDDGRHVDGGHASSDTRVNYSYCAASSADQAIEDGSRP
jgi:hypothetical protein